VSTDARSTPAFRAWWRAADTVGSDVGPCTKRGTRSPRTRWQRASHRPGWRACSGTPHPKCCSRSTRGSSRTWRDAMAARSRPVWARKSRGVLPKYSW